MGGVRFLRRIVRSLRIKKRKGIHRKRVMIVGAGEAASLLIKEMKNNKHSIYEPVVAIDDDHKKHNTQINGVPIAGGREKL
ncbi:MAG TPA: hypothetical protein PKY26_00715 [Acetivibrio clariflavus]|nr:hypothetical protein [Acetivibrio clariflavus]